MDSDSKIGQLLRTAYNRRDENILINHMVNWDGTHQEGVFKRDFMFENPACWSSCRRNTMSPTTRR